MLRLQGMKRFVLLLVFSSLFLPYSGAVISRPKVSTYKQPDGHILSSKLVGDENFHFRKTTDGYVLLPNQDGYLTYAQKDANGELVPSTVVAHNIGDRDAQESAFLQTISPNLTFGKTLQSKILTRITAKSPLRSKIIKRSGVPNTNSSKFLVLLVNFSDNAFTVPTPNTRYNDQFNSASYTTDGATGSVKQYFIDNSLGNFNPTFDVYGPVTLPQKMSYYGGNDASGNDLHPDEMIFDACQLLDGQINYANYDADNDGYVDNVYVIYAGYGEASGAAANTIWPHQWEVTNTTKLDGKLIGSYSCSNELQGTSGSVIDGIGTACHEFSHATGLPDFYDTDYETNGQSVDLDTWDVMASGCYNNDGMTPPYYTSIERELLGWGTPVVLTTPTNVTLNTIDKNVFYRINTTTPNEYYLIENRQLNGWDAGLYSSGMLVYHIDKTATYASRWTANTINAYSNHQCADLVEADGKEVLYDGTNATAWYASVKGDPFPGTSNVTSITDATTPSLKSWAGAATGKPITNIAITNGVVTFKFMGGESTFGSFHALPATNISSTGFTANWDAGTNATKYLLNVYQKSGGGTATTTTEGFNNFPTTTPTGWTTNSTATYTSSGNYGTASPSMKLDASGKYFKTPTFSNPITKISFWIKGNSTDASSSFLIEGSTDGTNWSTIETMTNLSTTASTKVIVTNASANFRVIRGTYTKSIGNLAIDDIIITSQAAEVKTYTLTDQEVTSGNSYSLTGLQSKSVYYYTVKAVNASTTSDESSEIIVDLATNIQGTNNQLINIAQSGKNLILTTPNSETIQIYNATGKLIVNKTVSEGTSTMELPEKGIYIVKVGASTRKVIVP